MRVTRRGFLQVLGGTAGAAALVRGRLVKAEQTAQDLKRWASPEESLVPSICQQCPGGCGLLVRTLDGEVAGVSGNPLHPINRGGLCPKAYGGLQLLYDPNRLKGPMARAGERGRFRPVEWDEALSMVTTRLADLRAKGLSHTVAILGGQYRGYRDTLWKRFAAAYGTPNYLRVRCLPPEKPALAHRLMQGVTGPLGYDLAEAQFVLSFGAGLLEAWLGPVWASQAFARLRRSGERPRGRFVQVDPRRSPTAIKADRWVPIVPGTDGILALGIANALIREGLYDKEFVEDHTFGFEDWVDSQGQPHEGFKNLVLREYGLLTVSAATGVPVKTILEIARDLATEKPALAHRLMQGVTGPLGYDLAEAQFVLSFGAGLLEAWLGPVWASQAFARLRRSGERPRGRFVQVDPRRSPTAIKADRWVPIVPGTDGILALGIANALIREGLYNKEFVEDHAFGFEDWVDSQGQRHEGFKNLVLREYGLLTVSAATGVPVKTILEIARDLATLKPALVIGERGPAYGPDDLHTRMAIHSLNALVGSIGVRGGLLIQGELPMAPLPPIQQDEIAKRGLDHPRIDGAGQGEYLLVSDAPQRLPERILNGTPYPISALFLFATNPLANHPAKEQFAEATKRIPFIVSFSPFLDESSAVADLILPDHTYLERWQDDQVTHLAGFTCFSLARPAAAPLHRTRNTADVVLQLAKGLGGSVAESFPWEKYDDLLYESARGLYEAGRGYIVSVHAEESLRQILERQGYWTPEFESYDDFWEALGKRGAWWDPTGLPVSRKALLKTPSGKFEFYSTGLKRLVDEAVAREGRTAPFVRALGGRDRGDLLFLPLVAIPSAREPGAFPLRLNTYRLMSRPQGGGKNQPWLLEQPAVHLWTPWELWVEIHPKTAAGLGVQDGDWVWVESAKGRIRLKARLYSGTLPDVIHIPLFGGEGPNPNDLIGNEVDPFRGFGLLNTTRVRVSRA